MTTKQALALIGQRGLLKAEKLHHLVVVQDVREAYGRIDLLVSPVEGTGTQWVSLERVELEEK